MDKEDIDFKIGSDTEVLWTNVLTAAELRCKAHKEALIIDNAMVDMAKAKIEDELDGT